MDNEENNSEGRKFAKEIGRTFVMSAVYGLGSIVGMAAGIYMLSAAAKVAKNPIQVTTTPPK